MVKPVISSRGDQTAQQLRTACKRGKVRSLFRYLHRNLSVPSSRIVQSFATTALVQLKKGRRSSVAPFTQPPSRRNFVRPSPATAVLFTAQWLEQVATVVVRYISTTEPRPEFSPLVLKFKPAPTASRKSVHKSQALCR